MVYIQLLTHTCVYYSFGMGWIQLTFKDGDAKTIAWCALCWRWKHLRVLSIHWELTSICSTSQLISVFLHLVLNWTFKHSFLSEKHAGAIYGPLHHIASCTLLQIPHIPPAAADPLRQDVNQLLSSLLEGRPDETLRGDAWLQKARMRREGSWGILGRTCGKKTMVIYWEIDRMGYKML